MKLIIDIPEEVLNTIKTFKGKFICENGYDLIQGIQNGTPLDGVKAEIDKAYNSLDRYYPYGLSMFAIMVREILDNIGKADMRGE